DITERVPEVVEATLALGVQSVVLDGEAIALRGDGRPHPFQVTMGRFGSRLDLEEQRRQVPLSPLFFDILHLDGEELLHRPSPARPRREWPPSTPRSHRRSGSPGSSPPSPRRPRPSSRMPWHTATRA